VTLKTDTATVTFSIINAVPLAKSKRTHITRGERGKYDWFTSPSCPYLLLLFVLLRVALLFFLLLVVRLGLVFLLLVSAYAVFPVFVFATFFFPV
jgi:hypothetical protein